MRRMPRKDSGPELQLRRAMHRLGLRFRTQAPLPGRPDIVLTRAKIAIFVDGCFWHRCPEHATAPKNNAEWWDAKLSRNVIRDREKDEVVRSLGWTPVHVWEHENPDEAAHRICDLWRAAIPARAESQLSELSAILEEHAAAPASRNQRSVIVSSRQTFAVAPSAARLTTSLRDIGYDLQSAVADLVDNSIAAGADNIVIHFRGEGRPRVIIADNGLGMSADQVVEALRFGSRREYERGELGRYGLGLKTASLSQARTLTVASRLPGSDEVTVRQLSLDHVTDQDSWVIHEPDETPAIAEACAMLGPENLVSDGLRTAIVWEDLDRVVPEGMVDGWARRRMANSGDKTSQHLAMVFHRFLDGSIKDRQVSIEVDGQPVVPWDPFARHEKRTLSLPSQTFEVAEGGLEGTVSLDRWVLPTRQSFSSPTAFEDAAGPRKWNRQQGIYIYRANRLVQGGGWAGLRAIDEHTKIARCALSFDTDLDSAFNINVAKMRVSLPTQLKSMLQRPVQEMCNRAEAVYRQAAIDGTEPDVRKKTTRGTLNAHAGLSLLAAATKSSQLDSMRAIARSLQSEDPELAAAMGLDVLIAE